MKRAPIYALLAGSLLAGACQKNEIECPPRLIDHGGVELSNPTLLNSFVRKYEAPVQTYTVNPAPGTVATITTAKGARITVPGGAFVLPNGTTPVTGPVQLTVREITRKPEMVLSAMPTTASGEMLVSGGEYYLRATQNNVRLRLRRTSFINIQAPSPTPRRDYAMRLFLGAPTVGGSVNWLPTSGPAPGGSVSVDSLSQGNFYTLLLSNDSLGWVNIDRFLNLNPKTTVTASLPVPASEVTPGNTMVFWVFNSYNTVARGTVTTGQNTVATANLPVGQSVTAVVIRLVNGQYYFGKQTAPVAAGQPYTPALRALSETDLLAEVQQL